MRRAVAWLLVCALLTLGAGLAEEAETEYIEVTTQTAVVIADRVNIRNGPGVKYGIVATVDAGASYVVTRPYGEWYQIQMPDGSLACVHKDFVRIDEKTERVAVEKLPELKTELRGASLPTMLKKGQPFSLQGTVASNLPLTGVKVEIRNDNRMSREIVASATFQESENVTQYDLRKLDSQLSFASLVPGEKTLVVSAASGAASGTVYTHQFTVLGAMQDVASLIDKCNITVSDGKASVLTDSYTGTIWRPAGQNSVIRITAPDDAKPGAFTVAWSTVPEKFTVRCLDGAGNEVNVFTRDNSYEMLVNFWEIDAATRTVEVRLQDLSSGVCELKLFQEGRVSRAQQNWTPTPDKLDVLLVSAHQDDEWLFFAGALPDAIDRGKEAAVLYMANCNRMRYGEAMAGLWHGGLRNYPIFLGLEDYFANTAEQALSRWGEEKTVTLLVRELRKHKPDVVLTHDFGGEYGHGQHQATAKAVAQAVEKAKDETYDPESAAQYGAWEVKKLYIHLYAQNAVKMDWNKPLAAFDGRTGLEMATIGFNMHYLIWDDYTIDYGKKYDYTSFGLYYSAVGPDVKKNDFFENLE